MIDFKNVSMTYRESGVQALKDVSFHIDPGEFCFIIGESGAGKSTLIKLLTREQKPESGQIRILGYDVAKFKERQVPYLRRNIGMVFQDFRLIDTKTVYENVAYAMEIVGASRRQIQRQVPLVLSTVGLRQKAKMRPHELSGGEQQRVAIARALVNSPMMLLADEPTGNLDPETSEAIMVLLSVINRAGTTVIICTHDRDLVDRMQRRVIEIRDGYKIRDEEQSRYSALDESAIKDMDIDEVGMQAFTHKSVRSPFNFINESERVAKDIMKQSAEAFDPKMVEGSGLENFVDATKADTSGAETEAKTLIPDVAEIVSSDSAETLSSDQAYQSPKSPVQVRRLSLEHDPDEDQ